MPVILRRPRINPLLHVVNEQLIVAGGKDLTDSVFITEVEIIDLKTKMSQFFNFDASQFNMAISSDSYFNMFLTAQSEICLVHS